MPKTAQTLIEIRSHRMGSADKLEVLECPVVREFVIFVEHRLRQDYNNSLLIRRSTAHLKRDVGVQHRWKEILAPEGC